jgi:hypothetical protein
MSDLLNSASLVLIPSGYKEDVVYSAVPTDGSGDLSFTRASNGTRVNSAGLVEVVPWNLLEQSNTFSNGAVWGLSDATVTGSQAGYDGTNNAWKLQSSGGTGTYIVQGSFSAIRTQSVYAKAGTTSKFSIIVGGYGNGMQFDLSNGTIVTNSNSSYFSGSITSVGNGWYYIIVTIQATAPTYGFLVAPQNLASGGISVGDYVFIQNAQVNLGSTAKPYFPTTDRLNVPRLTYQNGGGGCPSLLLEKQSTNLLTYSEQFDNAAWIKQSAGIASVPVVTANTTISPDGTQNADTVVFTLNGGTGSSDISQIDSAQYTHIANPYTQTIYAKTTDGSTKVFSFITPSGAISQITITGDWQRFSLTSSLAAVSSTFRLRLRGSAGGEGTSTSASIALWGAQYEQSSYPTSYIPTTSASATRVADACFKTGISSLIGQSEGVLFADVNWIVKPESGSPVIGVVTINNNVANLDNCIILGIERQTGGGNRVYCLVQNAGSTEAGLFGSLISSGRYKIALAYKANDFVLYVNGVQIATDTSGSVPTTSEVLLGQRFTGDSVNLNDSINEAVVFKTRLTNAELASLTTI